MTGPVDVVAADLLVGTAVRDVQRALVGGERYSVGLVEPVRDDRRLTGGRVVSIDEIADLWL